MAIEYDYNMRPSWLENQLTLGPNPPASISPASISPASISSNNDELVSVAYAYDMQPSWLNNQWAPGPNSPASISSNKHTIFWILIICLMIYWFYQ